MRVGGALLLLILAAAPPGGTGGGGSRPLAGAIDLLVREAVLVRDGVMSPRADTSGFAERLLVKPEPGAVLAAIVRPQHADPFVDAYVRWQLTGLAGDAAAPDERAIQELFERLPRPVENPRSDESLLRKLERAAAAGPLPRGELERLRREVAAAESSALGAEALNQAHDGFMAWFDGRLGAAGFHRPALLALRLGNLADRGWPVARLKADLTRALTEGPRPEGPGRALLERALDHYTGRQRRFLERVTFMADGSIRLDLGATGISTEDASRWRSLLDGKGSP